MSKHSGPPCWVPHGFSDRGQLSRWFGAIRHGNMASYIDCDHCGITSISPFVKDPQWVTHLSQRLTWSFECLVCWKNQHLSLTYRGKPSWNIGKATSRPLATEGCELDAEAPGPGLRPGHFGLNKKNHRKWGFSPTKQGDFAQQELGVDLPETRQIGPGMHRDLTCACSPRPALLFCNMGMVGRAVKIDDPSVLETVSTWLCLKI